MVFFLGKDVTFGITTESDRGIGVTPAGHAASQVDVGTSPSGDLVIKAGPTQSFSTIDQITAVDVSIGAMDEDISYFGMRSQTKAEIKKETTVTITRKKENEQFDVLFNEARYGTQNGTNAVWDGLEQPDKYHGYRLYIQIDASTGNDETITVPGCCIQSHSVTVNTDGTMDETLEFMSYITPTYATDADDTAISTNL